MLRAAIGEGSISKEPPAKKSDLILKIDTKDGIINVKQMRGKANRALRHHPTG
jgi:hypothetical protein